MDTSSDLTLRLAVAAWRASLPAMAADDIAELESHLLDSAAELQKTGLSASEAFLIARRRLGDPSSLAEEFQDARDLPRPMASAKAVVTKLRRSTGIGARAFTALGLAAVLVALAIPLWLQLRSYSASTLIEIMRTSTLLEFGSFKNSPAANEAPLTPHHDFLATELGILGSSETMRQVVRKLGLEERWNLQDTVEAGQRLRKMVTVKGEQGSTLVRLTVRSPDRNEARELAEELANAYIERRKKLERESVNLVHVTLTQSRKGQEMVAEKARSKMQEMAAAMNISDPPDGPLYTARPGDQVDPNQAAAYNKAKTDYQLQSKILAQMVAEQENARLTNLMPRSPATFHEHAAVPPDHRFLNSPFWWGISGGCGLAGGVFLILGLRKRRLSRKQIDPAPVAALDVTC